MTASTRADHRAAYQLGQWHGLAGIAVTSDDQVADIIDFDGSVSVIDDNAMSAFIAGYWDTRR